MQITVKYRGPLAELVKTEKESIDAKNIKDVLRHIRKQYSAAAEKKAKTMLIVVNGRNILLLKHFNTILKDSDEVNFLPICGGG